MMAFEITSKTEITIRYFVWVSKLCAQLMDILESIKQKVISNHKIKFKTNYEIT